MKLPLLFCVAAGLAVTPALALANCSDTEVDLRGDWGQVRFTVEVADDPEERAQGLMYREELAARAGMIFIFDQPQQASFWMKNTLIPLDMIFVDKTGRVSRIAENAVPRDLTPVDGGEDVLVVLEINGGLAATYGITVGSEMRNPAFATETALWPCLQH
ncbi:MAG: DUF192 domain-containing protein [Halocynthiibacter sp.]